MLAKVVGPKVPFVFSVDVEDPNSGSDGQGAPARVAAMTDRYLAFLAERKFSGTFFVVGQIALALPDLVRRIAGAGHELACHSHCHRPLEHMGEDGFRDDLSRALDALAGAGAQTIEGYRAPMFSLTRRTPWAHRILAEMGFTYSSSVLAAPNPLFSWREFGSAPRLVGQVLELPITMLSPCILPFPAGGVYLRALPRQVVRKALDRHHSRGQAVRSYLHPYDIDDTPGAPRAFEHASGPLYRWLLSRNRSDVFARLESVADRGFDFSSYGQHALAVRGGLAQDMVGG